MSKIKQLYEEVSTYLAAGEKSAAYDLIDRYKLENPRAQVAAVWKVMRPTEQPVGSNSFRYRKLLIRQAQRRAQEKINGNRE